MSTSEVITTGIVLKVSTYKENDCLVNVYTHDYGRITLLAKGIKKVSSKNASACQEFTLSEFTFIPRKGISTLIKASSIEHYLHIQGDLKSSIYGTYLLEYVLKGTLENEPDEEVYNGLKNALEKLNNGLPPQLVKAKFDLLMLDVSGILIDVDGCTVCGNVHDIASISVKEMGFVCKNCMHPKDVIYDKEILKLFRHLVKCPIEQIDQLVYNGLTLNETCKIIDAFVDEYSGIYFQSKKFF